MPKLECQWYLSCERPAVGMYPHPILGGVLVCQECADKLDAAKGTWQVE